MLRRHLTEPLRDALTDTPAVLVNGARQTGKSTLVQSKELGQANRQYLTFDDPGILAAAKRDPNGFIAGLNLPATLDEVQHVPELFPVIKAAIDRKRELDRQIASNFVAGSAGDPHHWRIPTCGLSPERGAPRCLVSVLYHDDASEGYSRSSQHCRYHSDP
jgi:hypothetical protein